jgi:hypothetical protein
MRFLPAAALLVLATAAAHAQTPGLTPPGPLQPPLPSTTGPQGGTNGPIAMPPAVPAPAPVNADWVPRPGFDLLVLDKISTRTTALSGHVGDTVHAGSISIAVRACDVRPPDEPQDATAFLAITDDTTQASLFSGWMFENAPSLSMLEHPVYDVRLTGCHA